MLTTHYMDEAERLCDRIAIMDEGEVITTGTPDELVTSLGAEAMIRFRSEAEVPERELLSLPHVVEVQQGSAGVTLATTSPHQTLHALLNMLEAQKVPLRSVETHRATLEDVFVHLTGKALRNE